MIFRTKPRSPSRRSPDGHGHHAPMYPRTAREMNRSQSALPEHGFLGLPATKSSVKSKRTTCDICRERKVRCNKEQPCERCVRLKLKCTYTPTPSSMNVSQTLMFLHERLAQAEAALVAANLGNAPSQPPTSQSERPYTSRKRQKSASNEPSLDMQDLLFGENTFSTHDTTWVPSINEIFVSDGPEPTASLGDSLELSYRTGSSLDNATSPFAFGSRGSLPLYLSPGTNSPLATSATSEATELSGLDLNVVAILHQRYFDATRPIPSIINRDRFYRLMVESPIPHQANSLSFAVAMAGASLSDDFPHLESLCYHSARHYIDLAEREDDGASFLNLDVLQALILVVRHEFMEASTSGRAWLTHGRAIRLVRLLCLDAMDTDPTSIGASIDSLRIPLRATTSAAELEERRRTFWVIFNLDFFIAAMTNTLPTLQSSEISTATPCDTNNGVSVPSPLIQATVLGNRALRHLRQASPVSGEYDFWTHHFDLDKVIQNRLEASPFALASTRSNLDPLQSIAHITYLGICILLHTHAYERAQRTAFPNSLALESRRQYENAATEVSQALQPGGVLEGVNTCNNISMYLLWTVSLAAKVQLQRLHGSSGSISSSSDSRESSTISSMPGRSSSYPSSTTTTTTGTATVPMADSIHSSLRTLESVLRVLKGVNTLFDDLIESIQAALENPSGQTTPWSAGLVGERHPGIGGLMPLNGFTF